VSIVTYWHYKKNVHGEFSSKQGVWLGLWCLTPLSTIFQLQSIPHLRFFTIFFIKKHFFFKKKYFKAISGQIFMKFI